MSNYRMHASPVNWEDPQSVRNRISELEEDLALFGHDERERWYLDAQIERMEAWLEDITHG